MICTLAFVAVTSTPAASAQAQVCGAPVTSRTRPTTADALEVLRAAVGLSTCPLCVCDVDGNGRLNTADALSVLAAVIFGPDLTPQPLRCPECARSDYPEPLCALEQMAELAASTRSARDLPLEERPISCRIPCDRGASLVQEILGEACRDSSGNGEGLVLGFACEAGVFEIDDLAETWNPHVMDNCSGLRLSGQGSQIRFVYMPGCSNVCIGLCSNFGDRCPAGPGSADCCESDDPADPQCSLYQCSVDSNCKGAANVCEFVSPEAPCVEDTDCRAPSWCADGRCRVLQAESCSEASTCGDASARCARELKHSCPDIDRGRTFLDLGGGDTADSNEMVGHDNVVEHLIVEGFFNGVVVKGDRNRFRAMTFRGQCDDSFSNAASAAGTVVESIYDEAGEVAAATRFENGCDKCVQDAGDRTDASLEEAEYWNVTYRGVQWRDCAKPWRISDTSWSSVTGRFRAIDSQFFGTIRGDSSPTCAGPEFSMSGYLELRDSRVEGCIAGLQLGGRTEALLEDNRFYGNALRGVAVFNHAQVRAQRNHFRSNGFAGESMTNVLGIRGDIGLRAVNGAGAVKDSDGRRYRPGLDLGGGNLVVDDRSGSSEGGNLFALVAGRAESSVAIDNRTRTRVKAEGNCWAVASPRALVSGRVDLFPAQTVGCQPLP